MKLWRKHNSKSAMIANPKLKIRHKAARKHFQSEDKNPSLLLMTLFYRVGLYTENVSV